ncbi:MAG TPA: hypothetical protein VNR42_04170 [Solirubrobacteraceae bacterium]|nr:hypothetical protein [Solirubrobacteraceae bacterium]
MEVRQRLLFEVAAELYGRAQGVLLSELLAEFDGEDLDRVLYAMAVLKRRPSASPKSPAISDPRRRTRTARKAQLAEGRPRADH